MTPVITDPEIKQHVLSLQNQISVLQSRNTELESDYHKILEIVKKKGVLSIADLAKLAIARRLHIHK